MPTSASNIIVKNGTKNTVVSADDVNIDGTSVISALSSKQDVLTPGTGIDITNNVISSTVNSAQWGNITGTISNQTDLQTALNTKQDTLVSGSNIKTVNGTSLLGAGDVSIDITPDNLSITKDSNDHLQAVGTVNKNTVTSSTNPVYDWVGTLQEYNDQNIETLHPDWICYITDDIQGGTSVYTKNEVNELLDVKANTDLDNLTSAGKNIANWSNNVTNCITEIPQDIKLELVDGVLTLKAGSKVYVPNGFESDGTTPKFNVITLTEDKSRIGSITTTGTSMVCTYSTGEPFIYSYEGDGISQGYFSGPTAPTGHTYMVWYDTANNIIKTTANGGSTWDSYRSFPIAIVSYSSNSSGFTSIDQVFNGFGYIGSTVFALPGVKGLVPNGRNADGSLKNIEWTANKVITSTLTYGAQFYYFGVNDNNQALGFYGKTITKYDEKNNVIIDTHPDPDVIRTGWSFFGECTGDSNNRIASFTPKTAFHAVDYQDVPKLATDNTFTGANTFETGVILGKSSTSGGLSRFNTPDAFNPSAFTDVWLSRNEGGSNGPAFAVLRVSDDTGKIDNRQVGIFKENGTNNIFTLAPTPPTTDNSTQIATTANVDAKITAQAVKLTGDQTIAGTKTFHNPLFMDNSNSGIIITNPNYTQGTAPSSTQWGRIDFKDKNNVEIAQCLTGVDTNNRCFAALWVHSPKADDTSSKWMITAQCDTNGNYSLISGVTPATSDSSTKIATTAYVNNKLQVVSELPASPDSNVFYFIPA